MFVGLSVYNENIGPGIVVAEEPDPFGTVFDLLHIRFSGCNEILSMYEEEVEYLQTSMSIH